MYWRDWNGAFRLNDIFASQSKPSGLNERIMPVDSHVGMMPTAERVPSAPWSATLSHQRGAVKADGALQKSACPTGGRSSSVAQASSCPTGGRSSTVTG